MPYNFHPVNRGQELLLTENMLTWLPKDHFVYFLLDAFEQIDTSSFLNAYRADGKGAAAYDPTMMATLLFYAYSDGERSSRRVEQRCVTDAAYRIVTGGLIPDHTTVARFRKRHRADVAPLFVAVLKLCLDAGLGDLDLAAADGSKFGSPASLAANRTLADIEKELAALTEEFEADLAAAVADFLAECDRADVADGTLPGTPEDEPREPGTVPRVVGLPRKLHGTAARIARLARAKKILEEEHEAQCADYDKRTAERAAKEAATGKKTPGRKPKKPEPDPEKKVNVTDPDSRVMKNPRGGHTQGYNAQAAAAGDHLKLAAYVTDEQNDVHQLRHVTEETAGNLAAAGSKKKIGVYLADSGYCTDEALAAIDPAGPAVLLSTGKERETRRRAAGEPANEGTPPEGLTLRGKMEWTLGTAEGKALYPRRAAVAEPIFAQVKHNRGFVQFMCAGLFAADSEWKFINATDNFMKLFRRTASGAAAPEWATLSGVVAAPG